MCYLFASIDHYHVGVLSLGAIVRRLLHYEHCIAGNVVLYCAPSSSVTVGDLTRHFPERFPPRFHVGLLLLRVGGQPFTLDDVVQGSTLMRLMSWLLLV
jgi:hypothetical protein